MLSACIPAPGAAAATCAGTAANVTLGQSTTTTVPKGGTATVCGAGYAPGATVALVVHSTPTPVGSLVANGDGIIEGAITVPDSIPDGSHTLQGTGAGEDGELIEEAPLDVAHFVIADASFTPTIEGSTFVQSEPGQPLGTPCGLYPDLPTTVTATATVELIGGQAPDRVYVDLEISPHRRVDLVPVAPESTTYSATFTIADEDSTFLANPYHYFAQFVTNINGTTGGNDEARAGILVACV
jgi:hypothetical protein